MEAVFNYPVDAQGRGRSGLLWQNFPDLEALVLGVSGQGYAVWDDFTNFVSNANTPWLQQTASSGTTAMAGTVIQSGGKGGCVNLYCPATNGAIAGIQSGNGYGPFYFDFLAQKYIPAYPLQVPLNPNSPPQTVSYLNDLIFEARMAIPGGTGNVATMPTAATTPTSTTLVAQQFFCGLAGNGAFGAVTNLISAAGVFNPASCDCLGFYMVGGAGGVTNGQLNFGFFRSGATVQTITNIVMPPPTGGTAVSPFVNAFNNAQAAVTLATAAGASANQANEIGLDYMFVNLGFRFFAATQIIVPYINGIPLPNATILAGTAANVTANTVAYSATSAQNVIGQTGGANFPNAYLAPTIMSKEYNSGGAVITSALVDWVGAAQAN